MCIRDRLNRDCVCGFYIHLHQIEQFKNGLFHIPKKIDWFLEPNDSVDWIAINAFKKDAKLFLEHQQSPLFWLKQNGTLSKAFLVWW